MWWTGAKPGDKLDLEIPVKKAGEFDIEVELTKAVDYAIVQLYLDGDKLGDPLDLYHPDVVRTEPIALGHRSLSAGKHTLTIEILGANKQAKKAYMFGLDRLLLKAAPKSSIGQE